MILKSDLTARHKINAFNTLRLTIVTYNCGVMEWKIEGIQDIDKMTRKQLCMNRIHAKKANV